MVGVDGFIFVVLVLGYEDWRAITACQSSCVCAESLVNRCAFFLDHRRSQLVAHELDPVP